jgi:AcrR family transcriptional regulator
MNEDAGATSQLREKRTTRSRPGLRSALLALLEEKTFEQVTIREITARAGVSYPTFFRHYADKEALLNDLAARQIGELLAMTTPILYTVEPHASARALCAYVWEHRKLWTALLTGGAAGMLKDEFVRQAQLLAAADPRPHARIPRELRVVVPVAATVEILAWWLKQSEPPSVERMTELLDELVVSPSLAARRRDER